jgi:hypothetical protein
LVHFVEVQPVLSTHQLVHQQHVYYRLIDDYWAQVHSYLFWVQYECAQRSLRELALVLHHLEYLLDPEDDGLL